MIRSLNRPIHYKLILNCSQYISKSTEFYKKSLILLFFFQVIKKESKNKKEAIEKACNLRLRPILLTSLTTIVGMIPLSLGIGDGSEVYQGLGISIIFGMSFSTLLTLIFVPTTYYMLTSIFSKKL